MPNANIGSQRLNKPPRAKISLKFRNDINQQPNSGLPLSPTHLPSSQSQTPKRNKPFSPANSSILKAQQTTYPSASRIPAHKQHNSISCRSQYMKLKMPS